MTDFKNLQQGQWHFIQQWDRNADRQITLGELRQGIDRDKNGRLNGSEIDSFALQAKANGFDEIQIQTMMGIGMIGKDQLKLFHLAEDQTLIPSSELKSLESQKIKTLPFQREALDSHQLNDLKMIEKGVFRVQWQHGNSCGTTSLSALMKYFQGHTTENSVKTMDQFMRGQGTLEWLPPKLGGGTKIDGYTAPREIVNYANAHGMRAGIENNAQIKDILQFLDQGVPSLCLLEWNFEDTGSDYARDARPVGDIQSLHWVNVIGHLEKADPETGQPELHLIIANPHGRIQEISAADFEKAWSGTGKKGHEVKLGSKSIETGIQRLLIAMVPQDSEAEILKPDGSSIQAGQIDIPQENDGLSGKLASMGTQVLNRVFTTRAEAVNVIGQLHDDALKGYAKSGFWGAVQGVWSGSPDEIGNLKAKAAGPHAKITLINQVMQLAYTRPEHENLIFELLKETPWDEFYQVIQGVDVHRLAKELEDDHQAGTVLAWVAKAEVDQKGQAGTAFQTFAAALSRAQRGDAVGAFLNNPHVQKENLISRIPASHLREMIENLSQSPDTLSDETRIFQIFQGTSWAQFDQIIARLDLNRLASQISQTEHLAPLTRWSLQNGVKTGNWNALSAILTRLEKTQEYTRADNILAMALQHEEMTTSDLQAVPKHLRIRMVNLLDDLTRLRPEAALKALDSLQAIK